MSLTFYQDQPQALLVLIFHYLAWWAKALVKELIVSLSYFIQNNTVANIVFFIFYSLMTQLTDSFFQRCVCISAYLSLLTNVKRFAATLSHYGTHAIDAYPYKRAWCIHLSMCVKTMSCSWPSFYQEMLWGWSMLFTIQEIITVQIILFSSTFVMFRWGQSINIGMRVVRLYLCHMIKTIVPFQYTNNGYICVQEYVLKI